MDEGRSEAKTGGHYSSPKTIFRLIKRKEDGTNSVNIALQVAPISGASMGSR
jgi:hypothetical protein